MYDADPLTEAERLEWTRIALGYTWLDKDMLQLQQQVFVLMQLTERDISPALATVDLRHGRRLPRITQATVWELVFAVLEWNRGYYSTRYSLHDEWCYRPTDHYEPHLFFALERRGGIPTAVSPIIQDVQQLRLYLLHEHTHWCLDHLDCLEEGTPPWTRWKNPRWR